MGDLVPARAELIALLMATRRWEYDDIEAAIVRAYDNGWPWRRILTGLVALAADPNGSPHEFAPVVRRGQAAPPERQHEHAARIRASLPDPNRGEQ